MLYEKAIDQGGGLEGFVLSEGDFGNAIAGSADVESALSRGSKATVSSGESV